MNTIDRDQDTATTNEATPLGQNDNNRGEAGGTPPGSGRLDPEAAQRRRRARGRDARQACMPGGPITLLKRFAAMMRAFDDSPERRTLDDVRFLPLVCGATTGAFEDSIDHLSPRQLEHLLFRELPSRWEFTLEQAHHAVEELRALYRFLGRARALRHAPACLEVLGEGAPQRLASGTRPARARRRPELITATAREAELERTASARSSARTLDPRAPALRAEAPRAQVTKAPFERDLIEKTTSRPVVHDIRLARIRRRRAQRSARTNSW